jgi:glycogen(starch) synthase
MNVLLISREYPPFIGGGIGSYTRRFAQALAGCGHHAVVVTVSADGREQREQAEGVTVVRLPFLNGDDWSGPHPAIATPEAMAAFRAFHPVSVFAMQVARALPRLITEFAIDAVEAPDTGALAWFALNNRRIARPWPHPAPLITVIHSPSAWVAELNNEPTTGPRQRELLHMEADSAAWSDGVLGLSRAVAGWAERHWDLPKGSVPVIPIPLGDLEPLARSRATAEICGEPGQIVFVGRLEPRKGLDTLIPAFGMALAVGGRLRLHLVGQDMPDPCTGALVGRTLVEQLPREVRERVTFHGRVTPERVEAICSAARVAVVPSANDNFPSTCVEAMARGRVVVAAAAGGMAEMIRDNVDGLLFPPSDVEACGRAMARAACMSPAEAGTFGKAAAQRILDLCGNDRVVADRIMHFRAVAARPRPAAPRMGHVVIIRDARAESPDDSRLAQAVAAGDGIDFAHGWTRDASGRVTAHPTPRAERLAASGPSIGSVAVRESALSDPKVGWATTRSGGNGAIGDTRRLAAALCRAGFTGAVVPEPVALVRGPGFVRRVWNRLSRAHP